MNRDDKVSMKRAQDLATKISEILGGVPSIEAMLCLINVMCVSAIFARKKGASEEDILDNIHQSVEHAMHGYWSELVEKEE
jgi:hypothetical protein